MAMKLDATEELVSMIRKSASEWRHMKEILDEKLHYYDVYCEHEFGIKVDFSAVDGMVIVHGAEIVDDDKYVNFLLRYGDMPNE